MLLLTLIIFILLTKPDLKLELKKFGIFVQLRNEQCVLRGDVSPDPSRKHRRHRCTSSR